MPVKYIKSGICRNLVVCPSNPLRVCNSPETAKIKRLSRGNLEKIETRRDLKSMDGNGIEKNSAMEFASERKVFSSLSTWFSSSFSRRARGDVTEDDTDEFCVLMLRPERQRFLSCAVLAAAARLVVVVVEKVQKDRDDDDDDDDDQGDDILLLDDDFECFWSTYNDTSSPFGEK